MQLSPRAGPSPLPQSSLTRGSLVPAIHRSSKASEEKPGPCHLDGRYRHYSQGFRLAQSEPCPSHMFWSHRAE